MRAINPLSIPRNHRIEAALAAALQRSDYEPFEPQLDALITPA